MMNHLKRMAVLLAALLLLHAPMEALAKMETRMEETQSNAYYFRINTFAGELPEALERLAGEKGFSDYACYSGAMLEYCSTEEGDSEYEYAAALVALEKGGERILVGMHQRSPNSWGMEVLGAKALLPGREFTIEILDERSSGSLTFGRHFSVCYPLPDNQEERYGFLQGTNLWFVGSYSKVDARGRGTFVCYNYPNFCLGAGNLPAREPGTDDIYPAYVSFYLAHMKSVTDFPTSVEAARRMAEESWQRFEETDFALCYGVNLREEATSKSKSLGIFNVGVLVHVLGQKNGRDAPWYHVRVGSLEGWMSGVYVKYPPISGTAELIGYEPLPIARTTGARTLRASPRDSAEAVSVLPEGTLMHVLATVDGGWLYVMVPRGELGWEMDVDGTGGYLRVDEVAQGASVDAIEP